MVAGDFLLDPESGEIVISAIKTAEDRFRSDDVREPAQRRADALVDVCRAGAAHLEDGPSRARLSADITMLVGLAEIEARAGPSSQSRYVQTPRTCRRQRCGA